MADASAACRAGGYFSSRLYGVCARHVVGDTVLVHREDAAAGHRNALRYTGTPLYSVRAGRVVFALGTDVLRCRMAWLLGAALTVIVVVNLTGLLAIQAAYYLP